MIEKMTKYSFVLLKGGEEKFLPIREGFVEVRDNVVKVCVEA